MMLRLRGEMLIQKGGGITPDETLATLGKKFDGLNVQTFEWSNIQILRRCQLVPEGKISAK